VLRSVTIVPNSPFDVPEHMTVATKFAPETRIVKRDDDIGKTSFSSETEYIMIAFIPQNC
jgi:hypothetical protein